MVFLSFNEKYYRDRLLRYEALDNSSDIYEAKQLLKALDDLDDEGYGILSAHIENKFHGVSRLRDFIARHGEKPFAVERAQAVGAYSEEEVEVAEFCDRLMCSKRPYDGDRSDFLPEIAAYCEHIGYDEETAYVFLLRDAMLPYLYYLDRGRRSLYPWVIGRDAINALAGDDHADDRLRLPIYDALENGISKFENFSAYCKDRMLKVLDEYPKLKAALKDLLSKIPNNKICVVESGYCGTVPMTLCALDERVKFKLYTTAPFLYDVYDDVIFCRKYENMRKFETLFCQDALCKYANFDGNFYVHPTKDAEIWQRALGEIYSLTTCIRPN